MQRLQASVAHLFLSLFIASLAFALVYWVWYPREYWQMAGGRELFFLVVSVDVVLGPLITLAIFNPGKGWGRMKFDLGVVALLQSMALAYGLWTVSLARPLYMVFTGDRFNLVTAVALDLKDQALAERAEFRSPSWTGPRTVGTRPVVNQEEKLQLVSDAMAGKDVELQPKFYVPYEQVLPRALQAARPLAELRKKNAADALVLLEARLKQLKREEATMKWLPVIARGDWVVLMDSATGLPLAHLPLNGF
jgi:hypothetical protein